MIPDPTQRFTDRASFYARSRPKYPSALLRFFQNELDLSPTHLIADIGSGTGFLAELFVRNGNVTYAVEPNAAMRAAAEQYLGSWQNFRSTPGTAEATTLPSGNIHFITVGQAFHWFDPDAAATEFRRVLVRGGFAAIVWNERRFADSRFATAYETLIEQYHIDRQAVRARHLTDGTDPGLNRFFGTGGYEVRTFDNPQILDRAGLIDRIASSSYMPLPTDPRHANLLQAANELFETHQVNGTVLMPHDTRVYFGRLG